MTEDSRVEEFKTLSLVSTYLFLKDKYASLSDPSIQADQDIEVIVEELRNFEFYVHISNKKKFVQESLDQITNLAGGNEFNEEELLAVVRQHSHNFDRKQKNRIFRCLVQLAKANGRISVDEKEVVCQVGYIFEISNPLSKLLSSGTNWLAFTGLAILLLTLGGSAYYVLSNNSGSKVNILKQEHVVFSEVFFNRFVIYRNRFDIDNDLMRRQAVFFLNGSAEISFERSQINFEKSTAKLTLTCSKREDQKSKLFRMHYDFDEPVLVDKVAPRPISEDEAEGAAIVIGVAGSVVGATAGAKFGSVIAKFVPNQYKLLPQVSGGVFGGLAGGLGGYYFALDSLDGAQLRKDISPGESRVATQAAMDIVKAILAAEDELTDLYKEKFDAFVKAEYASRGLDISQVSYSNCSNSGGERNEKSN